MVRALWLAVAALSAVAIAATAFVIWRPLDGGTALRYTPSVVTSVRTLARLESVSYHIERVIDLRDQQSLLFGLVKTQDAILFIAVGEVTAGVDLTELVDGDVQVDKANDRVVVTLPPPKILSVRLDNEHSWVFSRTTDVLAKRQEDLETRARREAESTLEQAAIGGGILERARESAESTVTSLIRSLGYATVTVRTRDSGY